MGNPPKFFQGSIVNEYFRDSLTELENFIDSYAADETDEDDDDGEDEQQKMVNLLKQQMMTNLTLMNTLKQNSAFPAGEIQRKNKVQSVLKRYKTFFETFS